MATDDFGQSPIRLTARDLSDFNDLLNFHFEEVRQNADPTHAAGLYIHSLNNALDWFLNEDRSESGIFEDQSADNLAFASKITDPAQSLHLKAEIRFHQFLFHLKRGDEWDAAWNFKQCHSLVRSCKEEFPSYAGIRKLDALLSIIIGSVPERYRWITQLFDMRGSVEQGLEELSRLAASESLLAEEAGLWHAFIRVYLLQQPTESQLETSHPPSPMMALALATLSIKESRSIDAVESLRELRSLPSVVPMVWFLSGEVALQQAHYDSAVWYYDTFSRMYSGESFLKDTWLKLSICYALQGFDLKAAAAKQQAMVLGSERSEADRYAAAFLREGRLLNPKLAQLRYSTDGGFYEMGPGIISSIQSTDLRDKKDSVEFVYRQARLYHKTGNTAQCENLYRQTIRMAGENSWYFAPNAALQLGYLARESGNMSDAERWFRRAMNYRKHEYKNSIDSKARSALQNLHAD